MAQDAAVQEFVSSVGHALVGRLGDVDNVCDVFAEKHNRHVAQAVLQLVDRISTIRQEAAHSERSKLRRESGFPG